MRVVVAAVGRLKEGPERLLFERYRDRFEASGRGLGFAPVIWAETPESRAASADKRKADEAAALSRLARDADATLVLDVRGQALTSEAFAALIARIRDGGTKTAAFLIGGPDGLSAELLAAARHKVSLGPMTLPHQLVRIVLAEQLYRAATILSGHPYHRG